jgi:hypothetical protein
MGSLPTSRLDSISSTLFGRTAPLTPLVTILAGGETTLREGETEGERGCCGCSDDEGMSSSLNNFILLY